VGAAHRSLSDRDAHIVLAAPRSTITTGRYFSSLLGPIAKQVNGREETGNEVNGASFQKSDIVGWIKVPLQDCDALSAGVEPLSEYCKKNPNTIKFNPDYKPA
ncbi:hypothetical protein, partial [Ideonella sp.]|uniref:hypothetical protein n=1 Tax=Ideonella sp. TaxID=1929293 RepID=UPI0037BFE485